MAAATELDLTDLQIVDMQSRDEWSRSCAVALITVLGKVGCQVVSARGFDEFLRCSRTTYEGHEFKREDFQRIFNIVKMAGRRTVTPAMILTRDRKKGRTR